MSGFVVDSSIAAAWCFADEVTPETDALLLRARTHGAIAPSLWWWEIANALTVAVRRGRITQSEATACLSLLTVLPIVADVEAQARAWRETFHIAQAHQLSVYDAAYLELALRSGLDLATKDAELIRAAAGVGVAIIP